jgi:hypothetical protein
MNEPILERATIEVATAAKAIDKNKKTYYKIQTPKKLVFNCYQELAEKFKLDMPGTQADVGFVYEEYLYNGQTVKSRWVVDISPQDIPKEPQTSPQTQKEGEKRPVAPESQKPPEKRDIKDTQIARAVSLKVALESYAVEIPKGEGLPTDGKEIIITWAWEFEGYLEKG